MNNEKPLLFLITGIVLFCLINEFSESLNPVEKIISGLFGLFFLFSLGFVYIKVFSQKAKEEKKKKKIISEIPRELAQKSEESVYLGIESELNTPIYLPDTIRKRHVHILGATGSGKTESVILNLLGQDISRGLGAVILDAKGDNSFIEYLKGKVPREKLFIFDLGDEKSIGYNPLASGSALEASQRLFSSMTWSEEYYKSKALTALQSVFSYHFSLHNKNPSLTELDQYFSSPIELSKAIGTGEKEKTIEKIANDLSGLHDQIRSLTVGHLRKLLSPVNSEIDISSCSSGNIIYFRLQSLLSPQAVQTLGKLIIQNLNYLAGVSHRHNNQINKLTPVYLDEFASFVCPEFADLISKARSAGFALHFSHQSIGDLSDVSHGFLNRITDNSATKIVLRINDPDSAEFFARSFGTKLYQKLTQKVTQSQNVDEAELVGEGSSREAHQFRSSPDNFKTLPTGIGSVLIAHGYKTNEGASHVFKIQFPRLT